MTQTAYVFVYLPDVLQPVVAGRFDWEELLSPPVGRFVYAESYLGHPAALPLDPIALPLKAQEFTTTLSSGFFGVFRDAIPDDWGRAVAARLYGDVIHSDFDYLFLPSSDRMGALAFGRTPQATIEETPSHALEDLGAPALFRAIRKIDRDGSLSEHERASALELGIGTSAGGARPKRTLLGDDALWFQKFNRPDDPYNMVRVEAAMLDLAEACGIRVPRRRTESVGKEDLLLIERFDRTVTAAGILRHRMVSAATVFQADEAAARMAYTGSYPRLSRELARWTITGDEDRPELFRRMSFNALCSVTDDHERNHVLVADGAHFRLSQAFDLVPQVSKTRRRFLSLVIGDHGALATRQNLLSSADKFLLSASEANQLIDRMQSTIRARWTQCCRAREVAARDIERISSCFLPEGFEDEGGRGNPSMM